MTNRQWVKGVYYDVTQEAQVDVEWVGSPDRNLDGSTWDWTRGASREWVWTDEAACSDADPELFQVAQRGDPGTEDMNDKAVRDYNLAKFEVALAYCEGCPIKATCLEKATASDRHWSVRGGELPVKVAGERKERGWAPSFDVAPYFPRWECETHGLKWVSSTNKNDGRTIYYCLECNRKG